jgi:hypothetical protein
MTSNVLWLPPWPGEPLQNICVRNDYGYVPVVVIAIWLFPHSWYITGFVAKVTRWVPLVEQKLLTYPEHINSSAVYSGIGVFCVVFCKLYFVPFVFFFFWPLCCLFFTVFIFTPLVSSSFSLIYFVIFNKLKMFKFQNQNSHPVQICYLIGDSGKFKMAERLSVYSMLLTLVCYYL